MSWKGIARWSGILFFIAQPVWADTESSVGSMGVITGGVVDRFQRDDPNGNMLLLKDALEEEVRQRRLSTGAIAPILNRMAPWITHLRDLQGDPSSLRISLSLDPGTVSQQDVETLSRVLNLPSVVAEQYAPVLAPARPIVRRPAHVLDEKQADAAFDAFEAALTPAPARGGDDARREWSASGAPLRRN